MTSSFSMNQEALAKYRKMNDWNNSYSFEDELNHSESLHDSTSAFHGSLSSSSSFSSLSSPVAAITRSSSSNKYHGTSSRKSLKEKSPQSVDRGLRIQGWVGGHTPTGVQKKRRSYKLKNPSDEIYLKK